MVYSIIDRRSTQNNQSNLYHQDFVVLWTMGTTLGINGGLNK
jgi:hypothetical protein